jgi:polar amino acid transport system substrate-binding protein
VQDGAADGFCTTPTAQHQRYAIFTDLPVLVPKLAVFCRRDHPRRLEIEAIQTLDGLVGFTRGDYLGNWSPDEELRLPRPSVTANIEDVFAMLAA